MYRGVSLLVVLFACRGETVDARGDATVATTGEPPGWVAVAAGSYAVGSPADERCREPDEVPRTVVVAAFEIARSETTRGEFAAVMGFDPSFAPDCTEPRCPVVSITWHEATDYCRRAFPDGGRLPSEAEWEVAARAGSTSAFYAGDIESCMASDMTCDDIAWYKANSGGTPHLVATRAPNAWGLFDLAGNAAEWVADAYDPQAPTLERVVRGGDWYHNAEHARSAARERFAPDARMSHVGVRCVRSGPP